MEKTFSPRQLERYPTYYKVLRELKAEGQEFVSSKHLAERLELSEEQVKKDLAAVTKGNGVPGKGRPIEPLIEEMEAFLGYHHATPAVLIGVGRLGQALLDYQGFTQMGLDIVAAFDSSNDKIDTVISNKHIFNVSQLEAKLKELGAHIAIITVPAAHAQEVADAAIKGGAVGIWNFAPTHITVPAGIYVEDVNLASSLAVLSFRIRDLI